MKQLRLMLLMALVLFPAAAEPAGLSRSEAEVASRQAWADYRASETAQTLLRMYADREIVDGEQVMPITVELIWDEDQPRPEQGYPVFISMHGGGAFTPLENEDQWVIQQTRYPGVRGIYICPHSPLDTWDQWHNEAIFPLIEKLVKAVMLQEDADPNRVYLSGYCSGGNGVYQLGPILADHFAAVSATKALSEGAPLENLRNCPIDLQWGEHDDEPVNRPEHNRGNVDLLYKLNAQDRGGYTFREVEHWRQGRFVNDKSTTHWLARFTRDPLPKRVVWIQGGDVRPSSNPVRHAFYWVGIPEDQRPGTDTPARIIADLDAETNAVELAVSGYEQVEVYFNDAMLDLDKPVRVVINGQEAYSGLVLRDTAVLEQTTRVHGDPGRVFSAKRVFAVPAER